MQTGRKCKHEMFISANTTWDISIDIFLEIINQYMKMLEHPLEEPKNDLDSRMYEKLKAALEYIEKFILTK